MLGSEVCRMRKGRGKEGGKREQWRGEIGSYFNGLGNEILTIDESSPEKNWRQLIRENQRKEKEGEERRGRERRGEERRGLRRGNNIQNEKLMMQTLTQDVYFGANELSTKIDGFHKMAWREKSKLERAKFDAIFIDAPAGTREYCERHFLMKVMDIEELHNEQRGKSHVYLPFLDNKKVEEGGETQMWNDFDYVYDGEKRDRGRRKERGEREASISSSMQVCLNSVRTGEREEGEEGEGMEEREERVNDFNGSSDTSSLYSANDITIFDEDAMCGTNYGETRRGREKGEKGEEGDMEEILLRDAMMNAKFLYIKNNLSRLHQNFKRGERNAEKKTSAEILHQKLQVQYEQFLMSGVINSLSAETKNFLMTIFLMVSSAGKKRNHQFLNLPEFYYLSCLLYISVSPSPYFFLDDFTETPVNPASASNFDLSILSQKIHQKNEKINFAMEEIAFYNISKIRNDNLMISFGEMLVLFAGLLALRASASGRNHQKLFVDKNLIKKISNSVFAHQNFIPIIPWWFLLYDVSVQKMAEAIEEHLSSHNIPHKLKRFIRVENIFDAVRTRALVEGEDIFDAFSKICLRMEETETGEDDGELYKYSSPSPYYLYHPIGKKLMQIKISQVLSYPTSISLLDSNFDVFLPFFDAANKNRKYSLPHHHGVSVSRRSGDETQGGRHQTLGVPKSTSKNETQLLNQNQGERRDIGERGREESRRGEIGEVEEFVSFFDVWDIIKEINKKFFFVSLSTALECFHAVRTSGENYFVSKEHQNLSLLKLVQQHSNNNTTAFLKAQEAIWGENKKRIMNSRNDSSSVDFHSLFSATPSSLLSPVSSPISPSSSVTTSKIPPLPSIRPPVPSYTIHYSPRPIPPSLPPSKAPPLPRRSPSPSPSPLLSSPSPSPLPLLSSPSLTPSLPSPTPRPSSSGVPLLFCLNKLGVQEFLMRCVLSTAYSSTHQSIKHERLHIPITHQPIRNQVLYAISFIATLHTNFPEFFLKTPLSKAHDIPDAIDKKVSIPLHVMMKYLPLLSSSLPLY